MKDNIEFETFRMRGPFAYKKCKKEQEEYNC